MMVTAHFSVEEFSCHSGEGYPFEWINDRLKPLCDQLEVLRNDLEGRSIHIVSGYRSPMHNARIGGAKRSQHMEGRAADVTVSGLTASEVHSAVLRLFRLGAIKIGGCGAYPSWVHVDVRPWQGHLCEWTGQGVGSEIA